MMCLRVLAAPAVIAAALALTIAPNVTLAQKSQGATTQAKSTKSANQKKSAKSKQTKSRTTAKSAAKNKTRKAAASPCKGLSRSACGGTSACTWVKRKKKADVRGRKLSDYCRRVARRKTN